METWRTIEAYPPRASDAAPGASESGAWMEFGILVGLLLPAMLLCVLAVLTA